MRRYLFLSFLCLAYGCATPQSAIRTAHEINSAVLSAGEEILFQACTDAADECVVAGVGLDECTGAVKCLGVTSVFTRAVAEAESLLALASAAYGYGDDDKADDLYAAAQKAAANAALLLQEILNVGR